MTHDVPLYFGGLRTRDGARLLADLFRRGDRFREAARASLAATVSAHIGASTVVAFGSARSAISACLESAGIGDGDEVVVTGYTCSAVAVAVRASGARVIYADIDTPALDASPAAIAACIGPRTRAIIIQHTLGVPADVEGVMALARARSLITIEDAALAIGSTRGGRPVGSFADAAVFSMELSKTITTGWGGVLAVREPRLAAAVARRYATVPEPPPAMVVRQVVQTAMCAALYHPSVYSFAKYAVAALFRLGIFRPSTPAGQEEGRLDSWYLHRLSGPQSALANRLWRRLPGIAERIRGNRDALLAVVYESGGRSIATASKGDDGVCSRVSLLVDDRPRAMRWFAARGIEVGSWFDWPVSPRPENPAWLGYQPGRCPRAEGIARHIINLPVHARLRTREIEQIAGAVRDFFAGHPDERQTDRAPASTVTRVGALSS